MSAIVRRSWRKGANRLCARYVAIPSPSFRLRAAALGRPRPHGSDRPCACTVPRPGRALVGAPFLRTAGAAQGRPPWRGRSRGPERTCSVRGRQAAPLAPPGCGFVALPRGLFCPPFFRLLASGLASPCRWPLRLPSPRQPSALLSVGRPRGFGLLWGAGGFRSCRFWWGRVPSRSSGFGPRPPCRPAGVSAALSGGCGCWRSRFAYPECDLVGASPCPWARPGRDGRRVLRSGYADAKTSPGYVPLNNLVPCPSSCRYENLKTAIDIQSVLLYH